MNLQLSMAVSHFPLSLRGLVIDSEIRKINLEPSHWKMRAKGQDVDGYCMINLFSIALEINISLAV